MSLGEIIMQLFVAFVGWFWPIVGVVAVGFVIAIFVDHGLGSPLTFLAGIVLALLIYGQGAYFQLSSYSMVNDLRVQFEAATAATDASGRTPLNINQQLLVKQRDDRLGHLGRCAYGAWWETKRSGEKPVASTNWVVYYFCDRYSE